MPHALAVTANFHRS